MNILNSKKVKKAIKFILTLVVFVSYIIKKLTWDWIIAAYKEASETVGSIGFLDK